MEEWYEVETKSLKELYKATKDLGGTISGEHGIGSKRKDFMGIVTSNAEMDLIRRIKKAFDPNGIMNPGKIFDME